MVVAVPSFFRSCRMHHVTASIVTGKRIISLGRKVNIGFFNVQVSCFRIATKLQNLLPVMPNCSRFDATRLK